MRKHHRLWVGGNDYLRGISGPFLLDQKVKNLPAISEE